MRKNSRLFIIFVSILNILFCQVNANALSNNDNEINQLSEDETAEIEHCIEKNIDEGKIPGLSIAVVKDNDIVYQKGFGYANIEEEKKVTSKSLFEIGSNSKAFTALGIMKLSSEGKLNLDDEITKYIPWLSLKYKNQEMKVTINNFLYQTSGVPFYAIDKIPITDSDDAIEKTVAALNGIELNSEPGTKFEYSTVNYDVLGLVIEKVSGKSYEEFMESELLKPLDLNNTYLYSKEVDKDLMTSGYKIVFSNPKQYDAPVYRGNKPAGYIISNIEDMARWLKIQLNSVNDLDFNAGLIEKSQEANTDVSFKKNKEFYAAGWFVCKDGTIYHGGNNPNYSSFITFNKDKKLGVVVLCNSNSEYVNTIAAGVSNILQGQGSIKGKADLNKNADKYAIYLSCLLSILILVIVIFFVKVIVEKIKKERVFKSNGRGALRFTTSLLFMLLTSYCIYLLPAIEYNGVSLPFVFIWLPETVKIAVYLLYSFIWLVYAYFVFTCFFKKEKERNLAALIIISALSGFGNALIIFTINTSIASSNFIKGKLLIYFVYGIVLYVYGQKIIREKVIYFTNNIVYSKRMEIINKLLDTNYSTFEQIESGRIESTLNNDTESISGFINLLISAVTSAITLLCCFIYLATISVYALLLSITIILLIASIYYVVGRYANRLGEQSRSLQSVFFKYIRDLIGGIKELNLNSNKKNQFRIDMDESCKNYKIKRSKAALAFADMFVVGELLFTLAIGSVAFIFPYVLKNLSTTNLTSYVFVLLYMTGPVNAILNTIPNVVQMRISLKRINGLISGITISKDKAEDDKNDEVSCDVAGKQISLKLKDVEYEYNNPDGQSFKLGPINYEFNSGEIVFITGGNGSGKSTLGKVLTGLYAPTKGVISLNNCTSSKVIIESYATIFADFYLFDKLYGVDYKNKEAEIQRYLEKLQINTKVQVKDGRFSTTKLSTGQKKRLALLVSYLEDRPIYLFDEWAADQDPEFRGFFYKTLLPELKAKGKCVIAVTHDDRYFNLADRVIKIEFGKIIN